MKTWEDIAIDQTYRMPLNDISRSDCGKSLVNVAGELFCIEKYHDETRHSCSTLDAIDVVLDRQSAPKSVFLIEFKGGLTPDDWTDHDEDTFYKKAFDTIHVLLRDYISNEAHWSLMFKDTCSLELIICLDSRNILFSQTRDPRQQFRGRKNVASSRFSPKVRELSKGLDCCMNRHPFSRIRIMSSDDFTSKWKSLARRHQ